MQVTINLQQTEYDIVQKLAEKADIKLLKVLLNQKFSKHQTL